MKILILGHTGKMGRALMEVLKNHDVTGANSKNFDADKLDANLLKHYEFPHMPKVVINCVAQINIDKCECDVYRATQLITTFGI